MAAPVLLMATFWQQKLRTPKFDSISGKQTIYVFSVASRTDPWKHGEDLPSWQRVAVGPDLYQPNPESPERTNEDANYEVALAAAYGFFRRLVQFLAFAMFTNHRLSACFHDF